MVSQYRALLVRTVPATALGPIVSDTPTVSWQVFECVEPVKVVDGYLCHRLGLGETQVHGYAAAPIFTLLLRAPKGYAAANGAEVELECLASDVGLSLACDSNGFALIVVSPEYPVASTRRAVAGGCAVGLAFKLPSNFAAEARSLDHVRSDLLILEATPHRRSSQAGAANPADKRQLRTSSSLRMVSVKQCSQSSERSR